MGEAKQSLIGIIAIILINFVCVVLFQKRGLVITVGARRRGVMFCLLLHIREDVSYELEAG